jgi:hypothetical protein
MITVRLEIFETSGGVERSEIGGGHNHWHETLPAMVFSAVT